MNQAKKKKKNGNQEISKCPSPKLSRQSPWEALQDNLPAYLFTLFGVGSVDIVDTVLKITCV